MSENRECICIQCGKRFGEATEDHKCPNCGANEFNWICVSSEAMTELRTHFIAEYRAGLGKIEGVDLRVIHRGSTRGTLGSEIAIVDDGDATVAVMAGDHDDDWNRAEIFARAPNMAAEIQALREEVAYLRRALNDTIDYA